MKNEKYIDRSLEELANVERKLDREFGWIFVWASWSLPTLGLLSHNNLETLVGGAIVSFIPFLLKFKEGMDFIGNRNYYYRYSKEYQDAYVPYSIFLDEFKKMVQTLGWDNEMKVFSGYSYLLKQGYLSLPHEFYYSIHADNVWNFLGSNVILGEGNCKHVNSMLRDLLCNLGYSSYCFGMMLNKDFIFLNDMEVKRKAIVEEESNRSIQDLFRSYHFLDYIELFMNLTIGVIDKIMKTEVNHQITFVERMNSSFFMDALNDALFFLDKKGCVFQEKSVFHVDSTKGARRFLNYGEDLNVKKLFKETDMEEMEFLLRDYYNVWNSCPDYRDTFENFYQEHKELYEEVLVKRKELRKECDRCSIL